MDVNVGGASNEHLDANAEGDRPSDVSLVIREDVVTVSSGNRNLSLLNVIEPEDIKDCFIPITPLEMKPIVGMEFDSLEDVFKFYNEYAWFSGFSVRKDKTRVLKSGVISMRILRCSKAGTRDQKLKEISNRKFKSRRVSRCDCPAKLVVNLKSESSTYHVTQIVEAHNHVLATPRERHWLRSHRKVIEEQLSMISSSKSSGIGVSRSLDFMFTEAGGHDQLGFTERDARNALKRKRQAMHGNDVEELLSYFQRKGIDDPDFTWRVQLDEEMRLASCFWLDDQSKVDYMAFSDVVFFDTTYKTNEYDVLFGGFAGVNHHMQTCLFGAGLLFGETTENFKWLFKTWLDAMGNVYPKVIVTIQDATIGQAIAQVFPHSHHILCLWHICKKLPEKLSHVYQKHPTFKSTWDHCLHGVESIEEFESCWSSMMEKFELNENSWLEHMYEIRHKWIPAFTKKIFTAGMRTTGRSESLNAMLDGFVNYKSSLVDFANGYEKLLQRRRRDEGQAEFQTINSRPVLLTRFELEAEMAMTYTIKAFEIFQKEVLESIYLTALNVRSEQHSETWQIFKPNESDVRKRKTILWDMVEMKASCSCLKFEFSGIICRHIFTLLHYKGIISMPPKHVLTRWTRQAKTLFIQAASTSSRNKVASLILRNHVLSQSWGYLRQESLKSESVYEVVRDALQKIKLVVQDMVEKERGDVTRKEMVVADRQVTGDGVENCNRDGAQVMLVHATYHGISNDAMATRSSRVCGVTSPNVMPINKRNSKRIKSALEIPRPIQKMCHGCNQMVVGHDKRTCPTYKELASTACTKRTSDVGSSRGRGRGCRGGSSSKI